METSAEIKQLAKALKEFQKDAPTITKDGENPHFKSKFATLENIIETTRGPLAKHGLSFSQLPDGGGLTTILIHESGEWLKATAALLLDKQTPQGQGSGITYMRRYALSAMLGLATDDDDDAEAASRPSQARQTAPERKPFAKPTKDPALEKDAQKERIITLLKKLGLPCKTKKECEDSVFTATGLMLAPENFEEIGDLLAKELEANK